MSAEKSAALEKPEIAHLAWLPQARWQFVSSQMSKEEGRLIKSCRTSAGRIATNII
jgi:hypothetical protein